MIQREKEHYRAAGENRNNLVFILVCMCVLPVFLYKKEGNHTCTHTKNIITSSIVKREHGGKMGILCFGIPLCLSILPLPFYFLRA